MKADLVYSTLTKEQQIQVAYAEEVVKHHIYHAPSVQYQFKEENGPVIHIQVA